MYHLTPVLKAMTLSPIRAIIHLGLTLFSPPRFRPFFPSRFLPAPSSSKTLRVPFLGPHNGSVAYTFIYNSTTIFSISTTNRRRIGKGTIRVTLEKKNNSEMKSSFVYTFVRWITDPRGFTLRRSSPSQNWQIRCQTVFVSRILKGRLNCFMQEILCFYRTRTQWIIPYSWLL